MFLRSNLHETFMHSIYRKPFVEQFGEEIRSAIHFWWLGSSMHTPKPPLLQFT